MDKDNYVQKKKEEIDKMLEDVEQGVKDVFNSDRYKEFLNTMSKFTSYSISNCILIQRQNPDATLVAGYKKWKHDFKRQVQKGEKAISILAPIIKKEKKNLFDEHGNKLTDSNGNELFEEKKYLLGYTKVSIFDVSQTKGKELPKLADNLTSNFENEKVFDDYMNAIKAVSAVPIRFDTILKGNGYFSLDKQEIVIKEGLSNHQTIKTAIHELAHSILHNKTEERNYQKGEIQAESVAYVVSKNLGIDTSSYSFSYIASWSDGMEAKDLKDVLSSIKNVSMEITEKIKSNMQDIGEHEMNFELLKEDAIEEEFYEFER